MKLHDTKRQVTTQFFFDIDTRLNQLLNIRILRKKPNK
jgi:hypothetical protein